MVRFVCLLLFISCSYANAQVTSFDGLPIYVEDNGEGEITLLFVHGWNLDHSFWTNQVNAFASDYRVVTMDLPGYGASGKNRKDWSMESYGKDVLSVINQLTLENVVLVAHSMGGNIGLEAISIDRSKIIALIGVDNFKQVGVLPNSDEKAQMQEFYAYLEADYATNVRVATASFMFAPDSPPEQKETILNTYASADPSVAIPVVKAAFTQARREIKLIEALDIPFMLISSTMIPVNEESLQNHYKGPLFKNFLIDKAGHFPMYERPEPFNSALAEALQEIE